MIVDFGAGRFDYTSLLGQERCVGVEVFEPYVRDFCPGRIRAVVGDMRQFETLGLPDFDCALLIDSIEHIPKQDGIDMLTRLKAACSRVLVFTPEGEYIQEYDPWGYENPGQVHRSTWWADDLTQLGFVVGRRPHFHHTNPPEKQAAMFARWDRD